MKCGTSGKVKRDLPSGNQATCQHRTIDFVGSSKAKHVERCNDCGKILSEEPQAEYKLRKERAGVALKTGAVKADEEWEQPKGKDRRERTEGEGPREKEKGRRRRRRAKKGRTQKVKRATNKKETVICQLISNQV